MKRRRLVKYLVIPLLIISLCFSLCSCNEEITLDKPYICYYPLDWGMTIEECTEALGIDIASLRSAPGKTPCGLSGTAYLGTARVFDFESDITLWFTSFEDNAPEGLCSIIVANAFVPGKKALPKIEKIINMYQADIAKSVVPDDHEQISIPFTTISVIWNASPIAGFKDDFFTEENSFEEKWNAFIAEKSANKDTLSSLTEVTLKYLQEDSKYRLDIRGEPAAYYNYLKSKKS